MNQRTVRSPARWPAHCLLLFVLGVASRGRPVRAASRPDPDAPGPVAPAAAEAGCTRAAGDVTAARPGDAAATPHVRGCPPSSAGAGPTGATDAGAAPRPAGADAIPPAGAADASAAPGPAAEDGRAAGPAPAGPALADRLPPTPPAAAPPPGTRPEPVPFARQNFFKRVFTDQRTLVTQWWPAEFRRPAFVVPLAVATAVSFGDEGLGSETNSDVRLGAWGDRAVSGSGDSVAQFFTTLGDGAVEAVALGGTYLAARWHGNGRLSDTASLSAEALLDAGIWATAIKFAAGRIRPNQENAGDYQPASSGAVSGSFPSGHTIGAFAIAAVFAGKYGDHRWVPWLSYGLAGMVGASRVALGHHFPSDVVVGAMLGQSIGRMVVAREGEEDEARHIEFAPIVSPPTRTYGLAMTIDWGAPRAPAAPR